MNLTILKTQLQNNKIPLFDLHCDTFSSLFENNESIVDNSLHISLNKAKSFAPYMQICAIWSPSGLSDELAFDNYIKVKSYIEKQGIRFATAFSELKENCFILAIEDARILNGNLSLLDTLYQDGVRFLTLNWQGDTIIGGGWDTDNGLTSFGKDVISKSLDLGIIIDISHSSKKTSYQAIDMCKEHGKTPIASHSNSYSVCSHKRNLSDELFIELANLRSLVGISLAPQHLSRSGDATISTVISHIYRYLSLGGENTIALGCDFDGVSTLPQGISSVSDLDLLYNEIEKNFGSKIAKRIFFDNAYEFMQRNFN